MKLREIAAVQLANDGYPKGLADLVREGVPLSGSTRESIATLIEKKWTKGRGAPKKLTYANAIRRLMAHVELQNLKHRYKTIFKKQCPHDPAVERVAARWGLDVELLHNIYKNPQRYLK